MRGQGRFLRRATIGSYLVVVIGLQALLFSGLTIWAGLGDYRADIARAEASSDATARAAAKLIADSVAEVSDQVSTDAKMTGYDAVFASPSECVLTGGGADAFAGGDVHLIRPDGTVSCTSLRTNGKAAAGTFAGSPWLETVAASAAAAPVVDGPFTDPLTGRRAVVVAAKVVGADGALVTVLYTDSIREGLDDHLGYSTSDPAFTVTSADGREVLVMPKAEEQASSNGGMAPVDEHRVFRDASGEERIYGAAKVPGLGWQLWAGLATGEALADAREAMQDTFILGIGALLVVLIVGALIRGRITRPVRALAAAVDEAADGNLMSRVPTDGPRELANLGDRFNNMLHIRARSEEALVEAYEAEREASERLRELDGMKNSFLMAISHELRTPLTAVVGYADLLNEGDVFLGKEEQADCMNRLATQAHRLQALLCDLLDVERMARGTIQAHRSDADLRQIVLRMVEQVTDAERVTIKMRKPVAVSVDISLLERVVENLLVNSLKHTPKNTKICVRAEEQADEVVLIVEDNGPGVPERIKESIFLPFNQGDVPEHAPGTGIGLALVSQFAKLHGGRAWVEDREGGGASFRVALPREHSDERAA